MRSQSTSERMTIAALVIGALALVVLAVYGVTRPAPPPVGAAAAPQQAIVVSYGLSSPGFGDSCGGVAVVRLHDGKAVRAASFLNVYLERGTRVTVSKSRSDCPPAPYTVWRVGPSSGAAERTPLAARR